ncbi:MAG: CCA tRNA nucleotidyltransferase [Clostridia bacterium]|nr:CCA tRNA nucleotidyltransferase [Clostridia bacterium]
MKIPFNQKLKKVAELTNRPLYAVGGVVRNFLIDKSFSEDVDLCAPTCVYEMENAVNQVGGKIVALYPRTGTVVFKIDGQKYEYTAFRKDGYSAGGKHSPDKVIQTDDIMEDALRRDFKCNAIYYDILDEKLVDPLNGIKDVENGVLDTVKAPEQVFNHDGLRLMRLARFSGELGFVPTEQVVKVARENAQNIDDISKERIWAELKRILVADTKFSFSPKDGHYRALKVLDETRVLDKILPDLAFGRGMEQRKDFHLYDVLEHSLKCFLYAHKSIRLSALLHDVAKPSCFIKNGNFYRHDYYAVSLIKNILYGLKADNKTVEETCRIVGSHMYDMDLKTGKEKVKKFIIKNADILDKILLLKQADFRASGESKEVCPTVKKWKEIYREMIELGTPFSIKDLKISAKDIMGLGFNGVEIGETLKKLLAICQQEPTKNTKEYLLEKCKSYKK